LAIFRRRKAGPRCSVLRGYRHAIRKGEILGIAGLVGSGRTEILLGLAGADGTASADTEIDGVPSALLKSPRAAIASGIVLVPEDRKAQGFVPLPSGRSNIALTDLWKVSTAGVISTARSRDLARTAAAPLGSSPGGWTNLSAPSPAAISKSW
jgi:ribose transport system ATP-binding protein